MRTRLCLLAIGTLLLSLLTTTTPANSSTSNLEIFAVVDSKPGEVELTFVSKIAAKSLRSYQITAKPKSGAGLTFTKSYTRKASGYITQKISPLSTEVEYIFTITITTTGRKVIKSSPFTHLVSSTTPTAPLITKVEATDADEAVIFFNPPASDGGSPVYYYTVISNPGLVTVLSPQSGPGSITVTGLTKATTYTFTLTAHNINGSSAAGTSPAPITTLAEKIVRVSPTSSSSSNGTTLAAPAFTLSSSSQSVIVNNAITTVTNTSTGGAIASYAISPAAPSGLSFSTTTGQLSGTPTSTQSATNYTITATNAAGSATQTFTLTVTVGTPAFSLSSAAETRVATTAITGYTITSTGAPITSYAISPTPPSPLTFDTSTGRISGTPTETRTATTYTIIGTSASGETATATYRLRVTGDLGDTGPGGGIIYYYLAAGFSCGPDFTNTGSPTGGKCRWLEVAPSWAMDSWKIWAVVSLNSTNVSGITDEGSVTNINNALEIGLGYKNSIAIVNQGNDTTTVAARAARAYAARSLSDWYLPTAAELNVLCQWQSGVAASVTTQCTSPTLNSPIFGASSAGFEAGPYWSSSEVAASNAWSQNFTNGTQSNINKFNQIRVRVVRSF
jgi:hypothetical protein